MGRRRRAAIAAWAEANVVAHAEAVARVLGIAPPLPPVRLRVSPSPGVAATAGDTITLHEPWFRSHPDDVGCVLHELSHVYLRAPVYDAETAWLIEGIADHTRDVLGFDASWTFAHYEPGAATAGYQTTAHFLAWVEQRWPGAVATLARHLAAGSYGEGVWVGLTGIALGGLVVRYERDPG
jgi:basic secretory peptidase family protein